MRVALEDGLGGRSLDIGVAAAAANRQKIRWADLSVQSTAILRQVVAPIHLEGYSTTDVAKRLGIPLASVRLLTEYLAHEVSELARSPAT